MGWVDDHRAEHVSKLTSRLSVARVPCDCTCGDRPGPWHSRHRLVQARASAASVRLMVVAPPAVASSDRHVPSPPIPLTELCGVLATPVRHHRVDDRPLLVVPSPPTPTPRHSPTPSPSRSWETDGFLGRRLRRPAGSRRCAGGPGGCRDGPHEYRLRTSRSMDTPSNLERQVLLLHPPKTLAERSAWTPRQTRVDALFDP